MRKIYYIARKEIYHILRDPRSLMIVIAMPVLMTFLYGFAINMDIENIRLAVVDYDRSTESKDLIDAFYSSTYFSEPRAAVDQGDSEAILKSGDAHAVLVIRPGYGEALRTGREFALGMFIDGSDNNIAAAVQNYSQGLLLTSALELLPAGQVSGGIRLTTQVLYNPDLKSAQFFVPGLIALILVMISALLTSITIAREKETGTMEQLLTAPVTPVQILIGKIIPYVFIALLDGALIVVIARIVFDVPFLGSHLLMLLYSLIYIGASLALGILISSLVQTQQVAMMFALTATMLPSVMLSGFIFAIKNMPPVLHGISYIIPARYFVRIIRGIMLKGAGAEALIFQGLALVGLMLIMMTIAARKFKMKVA